MLHKELFDPNVEIVSKTLCDIWPGKRNGYSLVLKCKGPGRTITTRDSNYVPKAQVELASALRARGIVLEKEIINLIDEVWEEAYQDGCDNERMSGDPDV